MRTYKKIIRILFYVYMKIKVKKVDSVAKAGDFTSAELAKYISLSAAALLCIIWLIVRCLKKK